MVFPDGFLWGAATAGHQVEGNNIASDLWALEHAPGSRFAEPSGDACDHYRLYREDLALLKELGFTSYRFSIEWSRVEPEPGFVSRAAIEHYRDVLTACHEFGLTPMVTLHHFASPKWLPDLGGWEGGETPDRFAAHCRVVLGELGSLIPYVVTINEANIARLTHQMIKDLPARQAADQAPVGADITGALLGADRPKVFLFAFGEAGPDIAKRAHVLARQAIREVSPSTKVGITLALQDYQPAPGTEEVARERWAETFGDYLPTIADDDFLGVQNYTRARVGASPPPEDAERTQMGYEFYPRALENVLRRAATAGLPLFVTEHGVATADDTRRVEFVRQATDGLQRCLADGVDVRGYFYWSALDNYEWMFGYRPKFGLIAVDRATQRRTVKDSARFLGAIAKRNSLS
ncbi:glycoside hydrolase family 1 protein [Amycolatopsis sp. YIM 10]|uniref:glycoside hydrolase family 1 protein n=1 Tax=Amycolatopsis sp. YIM 10 TaxID=2653857 RepID=UPI00129031B2|nr:family 1 glycosylhydrolase [Amycolatopsis sp. YIM 10]QFU91682.1 Beta-glucosidase A [Amycolatopsis sp. YIM 10]